MARSMRKKKIRKSRGEREKIVGVTKIDSAQVEALKKKIVEGRRGK